MADRDLSKYRIMASYVLTLDREKIRLLFDILVDSTDYIVSEISANYQNEVNHRCLSLNRAEREL